MTISDDALSAALQMEVKKDGLSQMQSGEWVLKLKVHAEDMPTDLMTASMGTRYVAVLVEVGEDEQPVKKEEKPKGGKRSQRAAILCADDLFQTFLRTKCPAAWKENLADGETYSGAAARVVRSLCGVESRSELDSKASAGDHWENILSQFEAWKRCIEPAA